MNRIQIKTVGVTLSLVAVTGANGLAAASVPLNHQVTEPAPGAANNPAAVQTSQPTQVAQTATPVVSGLSEQPRLINACRFSPEQNLDIYADAALTRKIRTLTSPTQGVTLTGIVGTGLAQIKEPVLGWIGTAIVEPCTSPTPSPSPAPAPNPTPAPTPAPAPAPTPTPTPTSKVCYQVVSAQLTVRTTASLSSPALGVYGAGAIVYATTNPPREQVTSEGRIWVEVSAPNGTGWMSRTGPNGAGENAVRVADSQCQ